MSGKKLLVVIGVLTVVSFAGSFFLTQWLGGSPEPPPGKEAPPPQGAAPVTIQPLTPKAKQLVELIREVREKLEEIRRRSRELDVREKRLRIAEGMLKKDADDLEDLRIQLTAPLNNLKDAKDELDRTRVQIATGEVTKLKRVAKIFEKMPGEEGGKKIVAMCTNRQLDDAAKILNYMSDKGVAKIMAEIPDDKAVPLVQALKQIREEG